MEEREGRLSSWHYCQWPLAGVPPAGLEASCKVDDDQDGKEAEQPMEASES